MNGIIAWFAENKVAANLLMVFVILAGIFSLQQTRKEIIPGVSLDIINISIPYPGASPEDVEKSVVSRVESAVYDVDGVRSLESIANEHLGIVNVEVDYGHDPKDVLADIKSRVDGISGFPKDVERPLIKEISLRNLVAHVIVSGPTDERSLKSLAEQVKEDLMSMDTISQVEHTVKRPYQIAIEVSEGSLQRYGLSFAEVAAAVKKSSLDLPTGVIKTSQGSVSVEAKGQAYWGDQFEDIVVRAMPDGAQVVVRDVAEVTDGFQEGLIETRFNGKPAVSLSVYRVGEQNILDISAAIRAYIEHPSARIPENVQLDIWQDNSVYFQSRIDLLTENALSGLALLFVVLLLFLRFQLSFWVSVGIPIAFMGAFWVLPYFNGSLNMISLFAFILVLGVVVDDAIIVGENIFSYHRRGISGIEAAKLGAQEVSSPVIFAVFTTVIAFLPLAYLPGPTGKIMQVIPVVVIATLIFSLVESLLVLPAHVSSIKSDKIDNIPILSWIQAAFSRGLESFIEKIYQPFLEFVLRWRYFIVSAFIGVILIVFTLMASGWVKVVFFSPIEADTAIVDAHFSQNSTKQEVHDSIKKIESKAFELQKELREQTGKDQIVNVFTSFISDTHGNVVLEMAPSETRSISGTEIVENWQKRVGDVPEIIDMNFTATLNQNLPAVDIELASTSLEDLREAAKGLKARLASYKGTYSIQDSFQKGKQKLIIKLKPVARNMGLSLDEIAAQVRQAYHGVDIQNLQRGESDVAVIVRYPLAERTSLWNLENMHIRLLDGSGVPLLTVADVSYGEGAAKIDRNNRRRVIRVKAKIDESLTSSNIVMAQLRKDSLDQLEDRYPGMSWAIEGAQKNREDMLDYMKKSYLFALLGMYVLMATLFRSYVQPLLVMFAIPFGIIGAVLGHFLLGKDVTVWSLIGMIAVSGVVVNDNLVLVDYINRKRAKGIELLAAIRDSGAARFRPILLTSITTFVGLTPLMQEQSLQAQFLIPMAISLAFGVVFATLVTLIMVPATYYIMADVQGLLGILKTDVESEPETSAAQELDEAHADAETLVDAKQPASSTWHVGLDEAYQVGFDAGRSGEEREAPYELDVLIASWEAGWDDGASEA